MDVESIVLQKKRQTYSQLHTRLTVPPECRHESWPIAHYSVDSGHADHEERTHGKFLELV